MSYLENTPVLIYDYISVVVVDQFMPMYLFRPNPKLNVQLHSNKLPMYMIYFIVTYAVLK